MSDTTPSGASPRTTPRPDLDDALAVTPAPADPEELEDLVEDEEETADAAGLDIEAPEADAQEQHQELQQHRDDPATGRAGYDANPADATEQRRVVDLDEEDYR